MTQTKRNFLLLLFLIGIAVAAGFVLSLRHKPPDVVTDDPRLAPGVAMRDVTFHSHALAIATITMVAPIMRESLMPCMQSPVEAPAHGHKLHRASWHAHSVVDAFPKFGVCTGVLPCAESRTEAICVTGAKKEIPAEFIQLTLEY